MLIDQHALIVCIRVQPKNAHDDLPIVAHNNLVDKIDSLIVDVSGHHRVFEVLQSVVNVDSLFY